MKKLLLAVFCCIGAFLMTTQTASATHLMGGNMTYEYLGLNSGTGLYDYRVTLKIYRLCDPGSSGLPISTSLGAYQDNPGNPNLKQRVALATLNLISQQAIVPPNAGASCSFAPNVCVEEGVYQTTISVPANTTGYYFMADRCCRNNNINNLSNPGATGQTYYAYAPNPTIDNNSPTFAVPPVPFICANDTVSILNQAIDVDGDSLSYAFVTPFAGISSSGSPSPTAPTTYTWPIPTVNYAANFSSTTPFGLNSYAAMDPSTGLGVYVSPNQGYYVVAIEISEYRNGVLIGVSRLDIQIIVITCPTNPAPVLATSQTTYTIQEGQTLCFNVGYTDPNGDSLFLTHTGDVFNSALVNPSATLANTTGDSTVSSQFCWTTSCNQGRTTPYQFSTSATDNGCPAKVTNTVYTINVINTPAPTVLNGPDTLCLNAATGIAYSVSSTSGYTYQWLVTNGNQVSGTNTATAGVSFTSSGLATVSVIALNSFGCPSDTLRKTVFIKPQPSAIAGSDVSFCSGGSATLGTSSTSGYSYSWSPATNLSSGAISNPVVTIGNTGSTPTSTTYILTTTLNGCTNKDTVVVTSNPFPVANAGNNASICSGSSAPLGTLATTGYTYSWTPSSGLSNGSVSNPVFSLTNTGNTPDTLQYVVLVSNGFSCSATDTVQVIVRPVPTANAGLDQSYCSGQTVTIGSASTSGYAYSWSPATGLTSPTASTSTVTLTNSTTANDTVSYILTTTWFGCTAKDTVKVIVKPIPTANAGSNLYLCSGVNGQLGTISTSGYNYTWTPATGLSNPNVSNPAVSLTNNGITTDTIFYFLNTNLAGCQNNDTVRVVVAPVPTANAGLDQIYCSGQTVTIGSGSTSGYSYSWSPATGLSSPTGSTSTVTLTNSTTANDTVSYILTTTWFGCIDKDTVKVIVKPTPTANAGSNLYLCSGVNGQLGTISTSGYNYTWTPATGLSNPNVSNPTVSLTNNGSTTDTIFYFLNTDLAGCQNNDTVRVVVAPVPTANAGLDQTYCSGQTVTIGSTSTSGYSYSWSPATGLASPTASTSTVTLTNSTTANDTVSYILTTTWFGCIDKDTVKVIVKPTPTANAGSNLYLCSGVNGQLGTISTSGYNYTWTPATGLSNPNVSNPTVSLTNSGSTTDTIFYFLNTDLAGCQNNDTVRVVVAPVPTANAGLDQIYCSGQTVTIGSGSTSGYSYSWSPATGLSSPTGSTSTVTLTNTTSANDTVSYILTTTWFGCIDKDTVKVIVKPTPTANAGSNLYLCSGVNGQLGTISTSGYNYTWTPTTGLSNPSISNPIVSLTNNGSTTDTIFYFLNTDLAGCQNNDTVRVVIAPVPTANAGFNQTICSGQSVIIGSAAMPGYTYSWSPATGLNSTTVSDPTTAATNSGNSPLTITYSVIATWFGCNDTATVDVTIKPVPVSVAGNNQLLCSGNTIQLGGSFTNGYTYVWNPSTNLSDSSISNPTLTDTTTGLTPDTLTYAVTTELNGCTSSDTVQVILSPVPTANAGNDLTFCSGQTGTIGDLAISNYNYSWSPTTGLGNASQSSTSVTLTNNTNAVLTNNYVLTTNLFGCIDYDSVAVYVKPLPVSEAGAAVTSCDGDTVVIGTTATNGYTYVWIPTTGLSSDTSATTQIYISNAGATTSTIYYTVTTTLNGCTTSDSVAVTSNPLPNVAAQATPASICIGESTNISVSGAVSYNWFELSNPSLSLGTGSNLSVTPQSTTTYIVEGTSSVNCINYDTITITVNPLPSVQILSSSTDLCYGDTLTLTGSGATTYSWIDLASGNSLGNTSSINVNPTANASYALVGTDGNSCVNSDTIQINVNPAPTINAITGTLSVCPGANGVQYWVINPNSTSTYNWSVTTGTIVIGQGTDTISIDWPGIQTPATVSVVEVTDLGCPSDSIKLPINVNVLLDPIAPTGVSTLCANLAQGISYSTINTPGSVYSWHAQGGTILSGDGTNNVIVDWNVTGPQVVALWYDENSTTIDTVCAGVSDTLYVTINPTPTTSAITGNNAICVGDSGTFSVINTIGSTYNWSIAGGTFNSNSNSNTTSATLTTLPGAIITVQETNSYGCIGTPVTYNVTINALPNADAGTNDTICNGTTTVLNASGGTSYAWTTNSTLDNLTIANPVANPSSTTTYYVLVTDLNGCKNSDSVTVLVNQLPIVRATGNAAICIGASTAITASGATNYSWSPSTGLDNSNISNPTANPTSTTTYVVIGTDNNGCSNSDSTTITVNPLPTAIVSTGGIICNGGSINLTVSGGTSFSWTPASGLNNTTIDNPIASPTTTTTYTVTVTDSNGCTDDDQVTVNVNDQPVASFTIDSTITVIGCEGVEITLINNSTLALNFEWNFGDGMTSIDANPTHIFGFGSSNGITLIAYNNQCSDTLVTPFSPGQLADYFKNIPNIFTPNNDGINDCFNLGDNTNFAECSTWEIYNRWGTKVFTSSTAQPCWNGKKDNTGEDQPAGTYFYILKAGNADYKGTVMLNR